MRGLRFAAMLGLVASMLACTQQIDTEPDIVTVPPPYSKAADLRTHVDLLLGEHVMIVAKESVAAVSHAYDYPAYTALLNANSTDLTKLLAPAFGNTAATHLQQAWDAQNGFLVDYAIGAASHDAVRMKAAAASMTATFVPQYAELLADDSHLPFGTIAPLLTQQVVAQRAAIDDYAAQRIDIFYAGVDHAYSDGALLGDAITRRIVADFPDKYPSGPGLRNVDSRVSFNMLLQEDSYLTTMVASASAGRRKAETSAATRALAASAARLKTLFATAKGAAAAGAFSALWSARDGALARYSAGDRTAGSVLTTTYVTGLTSLAGGTSQPATDQANATLKVLDDQLAKSVDVVAADDRAAATAMQPVADAIASSGTPR